MKLIQVDFGVKDKRFADTTGWVFGTFLYNNSSRSTPINWRDNLVPVGVAWGNDPGRKNSSLFVEGVLSDEVKALRGNGTLFDSSQRKFFGAFDRVNGPIDNPASSCLSCHATAQVHPEHTIWQPMIPAVKPASPIAEKVTMLWFRNIKAGERFVFSDDELKELTNSTDSIERWTPELMKAFISTDYSLQMRMGIENFYTENSAKNAKNPQQLNKIRMFYKRVSR